MLPTAEYIRRAIISAAVARQIRVLSTNSDGSKDRRDQLLALLGEGAVEQVVNPGRATVAARLADSRTGALSTACSGAINRWGISGDVVELVELLGPAVFQYLVNIEKARTPQHDARNVLEPTEGFGRASCLLLLSGKMWKLSKVIPVIQQRPLLFVDGWRWDGARQSGGPGRADGNRKLRGFGRNQVQASFTFRLPTGQIR